MMKYPVTRCETDAVYLAALRLRSAGFLVARAFNKHNVNGVNVSTQSLFRLSELVRDVRRAATEGAQIP